MGIRNLNRWLDWVARRSVGIVDWSRFAHTTIGIDILSFLYRSKQEYDSPLPTVAALIRDLRAHDIEPVAVFDGRTPIEKTVRRRGGPGSPGAAAATNATATAAVEPAIHRVSADDRNLVKNFLYTCGVLALNAEHEADAVLAVMARTGKVAAVISSDTDFLARGIEHLILPPATGDIASSHWKYIHLPTLLEEAGLTYDRFVVMCVLLGCDYAPTIPTISYQSAYWAARRGETAAAALEAALVREGIRTTTSWENAVALLRGDRDTWDSVLAPKQLEKWGAGPPPPEEAALEAMLEVLGSLRPCEAVQLLPPRQGSRGGQNSCRLDCATAAATAAAAAYYHPERSYG